MKVCSRLVLSLGVILIPSFSTFAHAMTAHESAEAIYKALQVSAVEDVSHVPGEQVMQKAIGGLVCKQVQNGVTAQAVYHCTLAPNANAGSIYLRLATPEVPLAPGYCGPSSYTKSVGHLSCDRTLGDEIGKGYVYYCSLDDALL